MTYEIAGDLAGVQLCHCAMCRRASGAAFAANLPVRAGDFRITAGAAQVKSYESSPGKERLFCAQCGSPIISRTASVPVHGAGARAGTLDEPADTTAVFTLPHRLEGQLAAPHRRPAAVSGRPAGMGTIPH